MKNNLLRIVIAMSFNMLLVIFTTCLFTGFLFANETKAQYKSIREVSISLDLNRVTLKEALDEIEGKTNFKFNYWKKALSATRAHRFTLKAENQTVAHILRQIAGQARLIFQQKNGTIGVKVRTVRKQKPPDSPETRLPERIISGKVTDEEGRPLPGASILIKGTTQGTITDNDGNYVLAVTDDVTTIVVAFIGYLQEEVDIAGRSVIDVTMADDITALQEVIVSTGYYEVDQRKYTGNIAKVSAKEIENQPISNPLQALIGRMTGVSIQQRSGVPGSNFNIQIRGQNSLRTGRGAEVNGNDPLYLINGVPYPAQTLSLTGGRLNPGQINPLNFINPNDIESIEILKDADATAIYGSRGANGVVRISTKQGTGGKLRVTYDGTMGRGTVENKLEVLNTEQYLMMRNEAFANDGREPGAGDVDINGTWDTGRYTDWQEELLGGSSNFMNHRLTFSGGAGNTTFLFGLNYHKETTLFSNDFSDTKVSGNLNLRFNSPDKRFELNFLGNFLINNNELFSSGLAGEAVTLAPNAPPLYNEDGSLNWENGTFENPLRQFLDENNTRTSNWITNLKLSYEILPGLRLKSTFGYNELQSDEESLNPVASRNPFNDSRRMDGLATFGNSSNKSWIIEPQIEYKKLSGLHEITTLMGATFQETSTNQQRINASGYDSDALLRNPAAASILEITANLSEYRFNSLYGRFNYTYNEKYIINLTGRRDGSSRFGPGKQFANFGAVGAAWIFSSEPVIADNAGFLSYGKLRVSYGLTGSDGIGNYEFLELWRPTELGYDGVRGLRPNNLQNEDFAWEETTKAEVGLEVGILKDRFKITTSYFRNISSNQLIGQPLPGITGFTRVQINFPAEVENKGWEIMLNTVNLSKGEFRWTSSFNISVLRNELVSFDNIENTAFANRFVVGEPLSIVHVFSYSGVNPESGVAMFRDFDGNNRISLPQDAFLLEDTQQDFFGGFQNTLSFKGFTFDFLFRFVKQRGRDYQSSFPTPGEFSNQPVHVLNRWQKPGDLTDIPRFTQTGLVRAANSNIRSSNHIFTDASFIRLQNISLSYQVPTNWIHKYGLENLRVYVQGQNLLTFTGYRGWDPESQSLSLPPLRMITAGLSVTL